MAILSWIGIGFAAGWLVGVSLRRRGYDLFTSILVAIAGALAGGILGGVFLNLSDPLSLVNLSTGIIAFVGAVLSVLAHHYLLAARPAGQ